MYYYASISLLRGVERNPDFSRYTSNTPSKIGFLIYYAWLLLSYNFLFSERTQTYTVCGFVRFPFPKGDAEVRAQLKETRRMKI